MQIIIDNRRPNIKYPKFRYYKNKTRQKRQNTKILTKKTKQYFVIYQK